MEGPFPAKEGETCVVCYGKTTSNDLVYVIDGQRLPVMRELEAQFLANPLAYVKRETPPASAAILVAISILAGLAIPAACLLLARRWQKRSTQKLTPDT